MQDQRLLKQYTSLNRQASIDSMDELVTRNIQDVVKSVEREESSSQNAASTSQPGASLSRSGSLKERRSPSGPASKLTGPRPSASGGAHRASDGAAGTGAGGTAVGAPSASGGTGGSVSLDVPGNLEASLRLHKARIRGLEDDVAKSARSIADKDKQLAEAAKELKALRAEKATWSAKHKSLEAQVDKHRRHAEDSAAALAAREAAIKEASKEGTRGDKERREAEIRARDVRLQRALEEVEKYKAQLQDAKSQERDGKDVAKTDSTRLLADNKRLERQRAELLVAFRKQLKLIDVLKRQKTHLEAARALQFTEEEFMKTLDMGAA